MTVSPTAIGRALKLTKNVSTTVAGTPSTMTAEGKGFSTPDQSIVRTADGNLLMAVYGDRAPAAPSVPVFCS